MTNEQPGTTGLGFAQWVSMLAAVTIVPRLMFGFALSTFGGGALIVHAGLKVLDAVLGVYLLASLRGLLNERGRLQTADPLPVWWVGLGAFCCVVDVLLPGSAAGAIGFLGLAIGIVTGALVDVAFGLMLLKDDPYGCLNVYAFSHIATGVCIAASTML